MTKDQKIETLRKIVKGFVPEILEPNFGCVVRTEASDTEYILVHVDEYGTLYCYDKKESMKQFTHSEVYVIGRPIRLTDVIFSLDKYGVKSDVIDDFTWGWDWSSDRLTAQSDECLDEALELLGV